MLSYRHLYHAGNHADVIKHILLTMLVDALNNKDKPYYYLDTHAGAGMYDLSIPEAQLHQEHKSGITRIWQRKDIPDEILPYIGIVHRCNAIPNQLRHYPGSPWIVRQLVRQSDHLLLTDLHPKDYLSLATLFKNDKQVEVRHANGYQTIKSVLPPIQRRGLVMIDPAYERGQESTDVIKTLFDAWKRWATGIYMIWYPIHVLFDASTFLNSLQASGKRKILSVEFVQDPDKKSTSLWGSGIIIVNPPWKLVDNLKQILPWLADVLGDARQCYYRCEWLVGE